MKLLNGAFIANLVKGKDGKTKWEYEANVSAIGRKKPNPGSLKEKPQFDIINDIEAAATDKFQGNLKSMTVDITKHLLTFIKH